jgi:Ser/Thr protein kinase RdoA (MazF antagonist)
MAETALGRCGPARWQFGLALVLMVKRRFHCVASIPDDLASELLHRYGLSGRADEVASGLSASTLWRLDSSPPVMVRVSEHWPPLDQVQRSCAVAASFAPVVAQVPAPLVALDGATAFLWHERPVAVWPFIDGHRLDRNDPRQRGLAARLLANLHRAALLFDGPSDDPSVETYAMRPTGSNPVGVPVDLELDNWLRGWRDHLPYDEPNGWMHGDFFHGNILCCSSNSVAGLIDWDDVQHGPLVTELASATWEFTCAADRDTLAVDNARDFLTTYVQAGGPVQPCQDIVSLIRVRLRSSIAFFRELQAHGHELDLANEQASIAAFASLRHLALNL